MQDLNRPPLPAGDLRYRVSESVRLYVCKGSIQPDYKGLVFFDSGERTVYHNDAGDLFVDYERLQHPLLRPVDMRERVELFLRRRWYVSILGTVVQKETPYTPHHFIDVSGAAFRAAIEDLLRKARRRYRYQAGPL